MKIKRASAAQIWPPSLHSARRGAGIPIFLAALAVVANPAFTQAQLATTPKDTTRIAVVFAGGHDTDPRDNGRPVVLIAAALGVKPEVFREAFSHVHPADPNVGPTGDEARQNKAALLGALGKYGITNERLDAVSDYYRYVRSRNELWTHKPATAFALVKNGAVTGFEVTSGGSGYSSPPSISVPGFTNINTTVTLAVGKAMETNGSISAITIKQAQN